MSAGGELAGALLARMAADSAAHPGVTRAAFGTGEQMAHDLVSAAAARLGAEVAPDAFGNLWMTLPGRDRDLPAIVIGSHLDSVPHGGNFDGAAGVAAGLGVMAELVARDILPPRDLRVVAFRAEEAAWFPLSYPGSAAALGQLDPAALEACRADTGLSLGRHMAEAGFDPARLAPGVPLVDAARIAAYIEPHIEQGPRLIARGVPVGIVSAMAGGWRFPAARIIGQYAHSGAEPRFSRRDVVPAFASLVQALEGEWDRIEATGTEATITIGRVESNPAQHGGSRVLGELGFTLDLRTGDEALLAALPGRVAEIAAQVASARGVGIDLGHSFGWAAAAMDPALSAGIEDAARALGHELPWLSCGAGHDAASFVAAGVPSAMLFLRNANGSHNPDEAMEIADLAVAIDILTRFVTQFPSSR
ncbi:hydantoinase/carbamoylase family amidase [Frigidibacter sp. MR17.14]|uniref:hydantoinase/carbamoylase family amidase n=1 Tax=Frigidibacter sp. MR17.14 TaxID=3126509 RepID=UPI003012DE92